MLTKLRRWTRLAPVDRTAADEAWLQPPVARPVPRRLDAAAAGHGTLLPAAGGH